MPNRFTSYSRARRRDPAQARELIDRLDAELHAVALKQPFLDSAPVRAARSLSP